MTRILTALCTLAVMAAAAGAEARERTRDGYVFRLESGNLHAANVDLDEALRVRKSRSGEFLWFRRGGRAYIVTDTSILARGREILRPSLDLSRDHEAIRVRLQPFEAREREVDNEQDRLEERLEKLGHREDAAADEERRRLEEQERALEARRRAIEADMRGIEDEERAQEDRERAIEAVADAEIARLIDDALRRGLARPPR